MDLKKEKILDYLIPGSAAIICLLVGGLIGNYMVLFGGQLLLVFIFLIISYFILFKENKMDSGAVSLYIVASLLIAVGMVFGNLFYLFVSSNIDFGIQIFR